MDDVMYIVCTTTPFNWGGGGLSLVANFQKGRVCQDLNVEGGGELLGERG